MTLAAARAASFFCRLRRRGKVLWERGGVGGAMSREVPRSCTCRSPVWMSTVMTWRCTSTQHQASRLRTRLTAAHAVTAPQSLLTSDVTEGKCPQHHICNVCGLGSNPHMTTSYAAALAESGRIHQGREIARNTRRQRYSAHLVDAVRLDGEGLARGRLRAALARARQKAAARTAALHRILLRQAASISCTALIASVGPCILQGTSHMQADGLGSI